MVKRVDPNTLNNLHLVLSENCARYQHSLLACLGHYIWLEMRTFLMFALLGAGLMVWLSGYLLTVYFACLFGFELYSLMRNDYYGISELTQPVYLHAARRFLIQGSLVYVVELLLLGMAYLLMPGEAWLASLLYIFIPLGIVHILALLFLPYFKKQIWSWGLYVSTYVIISYGMQIVDMMKYISLPVLLGSAVMIWLVYMVSIIIRKERLWNFGYKI